MWYSMLPFFDFLSFNVIFDIPCYLFWWHLMLAFLIFCHSMLPSTANVTPWCIMQTRATSHDDKNGTENGYTAIICFGKSKYFSTLSINVVVVIIRKNFVFRKYGKMILKSCFLFQFIGVLLVCDAAKKKSTKLKLVAEHKYDGEGILLWSNFGTTELKRSLGKYKYITAVLVFSTLQNLT